MCKCGDGVTTRIKQILHPGRTRANASSVKPFDLKFTLDVETRLTKTHFLGDVSPMAPSTSPFTRDTPTQATNDRPDINRVAPGTRAHLARVARSARCLTGRKTRSKVVICSCRAIQPNRVIFHRTNAQKQSTAQKRKRRASSVSPVALSFTCRARTS